MSNDVIGISGVAAVTGLLFLIRHLLCWAGRRNRNKRPVVSVSPDPTHELDWKSDQEMDDWVYWKPEPGPQTAPSKRAGNR